MTDDPPGPSRGRASGDDPLRRGSLRQGREDCRYYGVSRPTFYKRLRRYQELGVEGLRDRSRRPHTSPNATKGEVVGKIAYLRQSYHFGETELTDEAIEAHAEHGPKVPEVSATMHLYPINGACHDVGPDDTAFAYRQATFAPVYVVGWTDPAKDAERIRWVRDYYEATAPHSEPGGYINFMDDDDRWRIRDNYRGNFDRLVKVKGMYDPDNLFHLNQNIAPAK